MQVARGQAEDGRAVVVVAHDEGAGQAGQRLERPSQRLQPGGQGQVVTGVDDDVGTQRCQMAHPGDPRLGAVRQVQIGQVEHRERLLVGGEHRHVDAS